MNEKPRRFGYWLFTGWTWRRCLIVLAFLVVFIPLCYGVIDLWDRHAWNVYRDNYEAHVAPLDLQAYIPKLVSDTENFADTPVVQSWFKQNANDVFKHDNYSQAANMIGSYPRTRPGYRMEDLVGWQEAFAAAAAHAAKPKDGFQSSKLDLASRAAAAPAVWNGLNDDADILEELRAVSERPEARYPIEYDMKKPWDIRLPHLAKIKQTCLRLQIRADAELAAGQSESALEDVKLMLYLPDTLKNEPFLISYLVRVACLAISINPIWEGLAEHRWTDAQLQQLQARLAPYDLLADLQWSLRAERGFTLLSVDLVKKKGLVYAGELVGLGPPATRKNKRRILSLLNLIVPSGWYDQEKLQFCLAFDSTFKGTVDNASKRVFPSRIAAKAAEWDAQKKDGWHVVMRHQILAGMMLPEVGKTQKKAAAAQNAIDQAFIACALERYRLANGQYPADLASLVPRFAAQLPHDLFSGDPYQYRPTDDGQFLLYSIGWNEKDDGGKPGKIMNDEKEGDWVW